MSDFFPSFFIAPGHIVKIMTSNTPQTRDQKIIHLDMDAFYASVEILDNPSLAGKPVIVGGSSNRGVVSAASYEARKYGVHSAMPVVTAKKQCPNGIFLPVRMSRYKEISSRIMAIFRTYTPLVEPISLDEAFLDVTDSTKLFGPAEEIAKEIKMRVQKETGLTVSAGVAASKLLAKIASDQEKPDGLTVVPPGQEQNFLAALPIKRLWGVGKATRKSLSLMNINTIGDITNLSMALLTSAFGKQGEHLFLASRGIDEREVIPERTIKSVGHEETFAIDLVKMKKIKKELLFLTTKVGKRLRNYGMAGKTITLKVKYNDFKQITRSRTLASATNDDRKIFHESCSLLERSEAGKRPVRLLGISLSNLTEGTEMRQISLFEEEKTGRKRSELYEAVDTIGNRFGPEAIKPGTLIEKKGE